MKPRGYAWQFDTDFLVYTWYRNTNSLLLHILNSHFLLQCIDKQAQLVQHCESTEKHVVHGGMDGDFRARRIPKLCDDPKFHERLGLKFKWQMQEGFCIGNCAEWRETFRKLEDVLIYIKSRYNYPISQS